MAIQFFRRLTNVLGPKIRSLLQPRIYHTVYVTVGETRGDNEAVYKNPTLEQIIRISTNISETSRDKYSVWQPTAPFLSPLFAVSSPPIIPLTSRATM